MLGQGWGQGEGQLGKWDVSVQVGGWNHCVGKWDGLGQVGEWNHCVGKWDGLGQGDGQLGQWDGQSGQWDGSDQGDWDRRLGQWEVDRQWYQSGQWVRLGYLAENSNESHHSFQSAPA